MVITKKKAFEEIKGRLAGEKKIFLIGCGECSTTCKTGGEPEVLEMRGLLEGSGFSVTGQFIVEAPCIASQVKVAFARNKKAIDEADSVLILACGLGAQSVRDNIPEGKNIHVACDTVFMGQVNKEGAFLENCSACGECVLELTDVICPVTRCAKGLLNGPCGGQMKGKCEVDKEKDCAWILIYESLKRKNRLHVLNEIIPPKTHSKALRPRKVTL